MNESHAIMRYICASRQLPDHWYPTSANRDILRQEKIDEYLDWHHAGIRSGAGSFLFFKYFGAMAGKPASKSKLDMLYNHMEKSLHTISKNWLNPNRGTKFMFGN